MRALCQKIDWKDTILGLIYVVGSIFHDQVLSVQQHLLGEMLSVLTLGVLQ